MAEMGSDAPSARALRTVPLFAGLSDESLAGVLKTAAPFDVPAGQVLIEAGQAGAGLFVIEEGTVAVGAGPQKIELGAGEFFGELALLTSDATHAVRVSAKTPVSGLAIARNDFRALLEGEPKVVLAMLEVLAQRLASAMH